MLRTHNFRYALGLSCLLAALALPSAAWSADNGIYIGGSFGEVSSDYDLMFGQGSETDDNGFKAIIGRSTGLRSKPTTQTLARRARR